MSPVTGRHLQQLRSLSAFPLAQLDRLASDLSVRSFKKNDTVFDQDQKATRVYLLLSGVVRVSYLSSHERHTIVNLLPAGEFFGLDSLLPKARHAFRCEAFENCVVGAIRPEAFIETLLGVEYHTFLRWYAATMQSGRRMYIHCIKGIGLDLRKRLALELINLAERFGVAVESGVAIVLNVSHELLAGLIGASRQQVTEYLNAFDREKVIIRDNRRIIVNIAKLRRIAER